MIVKERETVLRLDGVNIQDNKLSCKHECLYFIVFCMFDIVY